MPKSRLGGVARNNDIEEGGDAGEVLETLEVTVSTASKTDASGKLRSRHDSTVAGRSSGTSCWISLFEREEVIQCPPSL